MKKARTIMACLLLAFLCRSPVWAMDYDRMTNQELADLRGAISNAPAEEQAAYQKEWAKRLMVMSEEEKKQYLPQSESPTGEERPKKPYVLGQGYENQGAGTVIYGGGTGIPGEGNTTQKK